MVLVWSIDIEKGGDKNQMESNIEWKKLLLNLKMFLCKLLLAFNLSLSCMQRNIFTSKNS